MQTNTSTPSLKRLIITLILLQIIMGVTIGGVNILLTDVLQWIPDNSAVTTGINIASMWLAGYIFGYRQEKKYPSFLHNKLNKIALITSLTWFIPLALVTCIITLYQDGVQVNAGGFLFLLIWFTFCGFLTYLVTYLSIKQGIKIRARYLKQNMTAQ